MQEDFECNFNGPNVEEKFEKITDFLSVGLGFTSKSNAWAGPDHWKYRKAKGRHRKKNLNFILSFFVSHVQLLEENDCRFRSKTIIGYEH